MAFYPIEWHEEVLRNSEDYYARRLAELKRLAADVRKHRIKNDLTRRQIAEAKRLGKESFDADRFLVKRKG